MQLNEKQQLCIEKAGTGNNLFITGSGGVGKSVVINKLKEKLKSSAILLAPTGIAALNVGGATLHRTFGLPFSISHEDEWFSVNKTCGELFEDDTIETLIIDEISMVRADSFIAIDKKLRKIKGFHDIPFGGLQVILVGDFFQLSPVLTRNESDAYFDLFDSTYCFKTDTWNDLDLEIIELDQVMRQDDKNTVRALNAIRHGKQAPAILKWLNGKCEGNDVAEDAVTLCTTNASASAINESFYEEIDYPEHTFRASIDGQFNEQPVDRTINLKETCRVIICANNAKNGYRNGQTGEVVRFVDHEEDPYIVVKLDNGSHVKVEHCTWESFSYKVVKRKLTKVLNGTFTQFPIKLGYGITIHKSQGMTLDECIIDMGNGAFAHGQTYVALSRIRSLDKLSLDRDIYQSDIIVDQEVIDFYRELKNGNKM